MCPSSDEFYLCRLDQGQVEEQQVVFEWRDDNGDEIPDCIEMMMEDGGGEEGPDWDMDDFAIGRNYQAVLE